MSDSTDAGGPSSEQPEENGSNVPRRPPPAGSQDPSKDADHAGDFLFVLDEEGRVEQIGPRAARELGLPPEQILGRRIEDILPAGAGPQSSPADPDPWGPDAGLAAADAHGSHTFEITQGELSAIFRDAPLMMILIDHQGRVRHVNRSAVRFTHRRASSMIGGHPGEAIRCYHALDNPRGCGYGLFCKTCPLRCAIEDAFRHKTSRHRMEAHLPLDRQTPQGETHVLISTIPLRASGQPAVLVCIEDITERKQAEQALTETQRTHATLMSNLPGMAYRCREDEHWTMEFVSEGCFELTGYLADELVWNRATSYEALIHPDDRQMVRHTAEAAVRRREPFEFLYRITTANAEAKWVWEKGRGVFSPTGRLVALEGFITDITARKQAEEEKGRMQDLLLHSQKMEAIGILAGGIAHDFNNLLTIIEGNAQLAAMATEDGELVGTDLLHNVLAAAERGASLVRQLRIFSNKQPLERVSISVNKTIGDLFQMLGRVIGEDISLQADLSPDLWTIGGDETNIEQVIMNLVVNARDAMPEGGQITIRTENVTADRKLGATMPEPRPGCFVRLTVADTGVGIAPDTLQHIFEPFFSTKDPGESSGLGLSLVYGIVKQHDGWVTVDSAPDEGSEFHVYLPASFPKPEQRASEKAQLDRLRGNGERVLLVEDEDGVREFVRRALSRNGYQVSAAPNARRAQALFREHDSEFDLLLSDVVLPGQSGVALADTLIGLKPDLKILLTSGYADHKSQWEVIRSRGLRFLQKPYTVLNLLRATRGVLRASS